jgi:GNAT superfamily N-acetyltransferase
MPWVAFAGPGTGPEVVVAALHRLATLDDAAALFDLRRRSILELAVRGLPSGEAEAWVAKHTLARMERKLREFEIWVAELDRGIAGWGAIGGDYLEGLYTAPEFAGRGVASGMLDRLEGLMRNRGIPTVRADASSNARDFYLRRGFRLIGPQGPARTWPIEKHLR